MIHDTTSHGRAKARTVDSAKIKIKGPWTAISNKLLTDQRLSRDARMLGCLMFMYAGNSGRAFPTQEELATQLAFTAQVPVTDERGQTVKDAQGRIITEGIYRDVSVRSIQRWLSELKAAGWLDWRQTIRNNTYTLLDPTAITHATQDDPTGPQAGQAGETQETYPPQPASYADHACATTATEGSPRTTEGSPRTTEGSPRATEGSYPSSIENSSKQDSESSDIKTDDDDESHPVLKQADQIAHTASSLFLAQRGINAAIEFRALPLEVIAQVWDDIMGRDQSARPGAVVKALRALTPLHTVLPATNALDRDRPVPVTYDEQDLRESCHPTSAAAVSSTPPVDCDPPRAAIQNVPDVVARDPLVTTVPEEQPPRTPIQPTTALTPPSADASVRDPSPGMIDHDAVSPVPRHRLAQIWQGALHTIRAQISRNAFETWLRDAQIVAFADHEVVIAVNSSEHQSWFNRHLVMIRRALWAEVGAPVQVRIVDRRTPDLAHCGYC